MMEPQALELYEVLKAGLSGGGDLDTTINRTVAITSIAISLKRIADALSYQPGPENLFDILRAAKCAAEGIENQSRG